MSTPHEDVCETFTQRGYGQLQEAALGTNQAENPLIPVVTIHVVFWRDMGLRGVWGEEASSEDTAPSLEDFGLKTSWQVNKAEAVILKLHNYYVCVSSIGTDLIYVFSV